MEINFFPDVTASMHFFYVSLNALFLRKFGVLSAFTFLAIISKLGFGRYNARACKKHLACFNVFGKHYHSFPYLPSHEVSHVPRTRMAFTRYISLLRSGYGHALVFSC
jgi:hypothetical protein